MIIYGYGEKDARVWNKRSNRVDLKELTSKYAKTCRQNNIGLSDNGCMQNINFKHYSFLNFNRVIDSANVNIIPYISVQTIGLIKSEKCDFKFYSIDDDKTSMKAVFKTPKIFDHNHNIEFHAQVYGFCKFYESGNKVPSVRPNEHKSRLYAQMFIEHYIILPNYKHARQLEKVLSTIHKLKK